jgi:hypothetical protein
LPYPPGAGLSAAAPADPGAPSASGRCAPTWPAGLPTAQAAARGRRSTRKCEPGLGTAGRPTGLPRAKTTQNLINNFLGQTTDANGNTPNPMGPVMANAGDGPGGKLRRMPMKLLQAEADLCIAACPRGDWTQKVINTLPSSRTTSDEVCATPSTP